MGDIVIGGVRPVGVARDPGIRADAEDFGAAQGRALANLGETVTNLGAHLQAQIQEPRDKVGLLRYKIDREMALDKSFEEAKTAAPAGAQGFTDGLRQKWQQDSANADLSTYGLSKKAQQQARLMDMEMQSNYAMSALTWERNEGVRQIGKDVEQNVGKIVESARTHGDFDGAWNDIKENLAAAGQALDPEQEAKVKDWASLQLFQADNAANPEGARGKLFGAGDAPALLRRFEGFRSGAYWDVNAFRAGYGSDTVTRADGSIEKVTKDTTVTRADAERDLARRSQEFSNTASGQVGSYAWDNLDAGTRTALTSVAYNYGSLPESVVGAVRKGDKEGIAQAVEALPANPGRRKQEAAIVRSGLNKPAPEYADLPYDDRVKLFEQSVTAEKTAEREHHALETEQDKEQREAITKAGYDMMLADDLAGPDEPKQLTPEWVEANRDVLNVSDYKAMLKQFEPTSTAKRTPPKEYIRLLDLAENDPERAQEEVRTLYGNDVIAKDVFNTVMSRARKNEKQTGGRKFAAEIRSYVSTSLTPERDAPQWQDARKLDALFQFDDYLEKNQNADRETLRKQAQGIVDDYKKIRYQRGQNTLPMPRFTLRTPDTLDVPELENVMTKTRGSFEAHMINEREAAEQAAIIRRWMDIVRYRDKQ